MKIIISLLIFIFSFSSNALDLTTVNLNCEGGKEDCEYLNSLFKTLVGQYRSSLHLKNSIKALLVSGGFKHLSYSIDLVDKKLFLNIDITMKEKILKIDFEFLKEQFAGDPKQLTSIKAGDFFEPEQMALIVRDVRGRLSEQGYPDVTLEIKEEQVSAGRNIYVRIDLGRANIFKNIEVTSNSKFVKTFLKNKFLSYKHNIYVAAKFKNYVEEAKKELFDFGYYLIDIDTDVLTEKKNVTINLTTTNDELYKFNFLNANYINRTDLLQAIKDLFTKYKRTVANNIMVQKLNELYTSFGLLNVKIKISKRKYRNKFNEEIIHYDLNIFETQKSVILNLSFSGNSYFSKGKIEKLYRSKAFELASLSYYDESYLTTFKEILMREYIQSGFVRVDVQGPYIKWNEDKSIGEVEYIINEGRRMMVRDVQLIGIPDESLKRKILDTMTNKPQSAFNPVLFSEELSKSLNFLRNEGYYYVSLVNANSDNIVIYDNQTQTVVLSPRYDLGPQIRLNNVILIGNVKTKRKVIQKKIKLKKDEIITPDKLQEIEGALSGTGLFSSVELKPLSYDKKHQSVDLIVKVNERDYGILELAPGFRTDIGVKLSALVGYNNIDGMNRSLSFKGQINQRLNYQTFDERRKKEQRKVLENSWTLTFNQNDLLDTEIDYATSISSQRKRFYSFDADIMRINNTISKDFSPKFSSSLRHQYEDISQFDGTQDRDNGSFKIGALTPSLTFDFRNNRINPTSGTFFNVSCEFANPSFLSQKNEDLTVNYYKLISRNRFYLPIGPSVIAVSLAVGLQENLEKSLKKDDLGNVVEEDGLRLTQGYIPNIKVFRLSGMDIVRGYNDEEINRLSDGTDISTLRVQDKAYMTNLKLEPRYFINDNLMAGVFYDAGRVFIGSMDLSDLRQSVGVTFKILTPVGSLDFDYGIKLLRKKDSSGRLEDPGRFHVSIGFF